MNQEAVNIKVRSLFTLTINHVICCSHHKFILEYQHISPEFIYKSVLNEYLVKNMKQDKQVILLRGLKVEIVYVANCIFLGIGMTSAVGQILLGLFGTHSALIFQFNNTYPCKARGKAMYWTIAVAWIWQMLCHTSYWHLLSLTCDLCGRLL